MNILLMSDTHGDLLRIDEVLDRFKKPELVIHLGDMDRDGEYLSHRLPPDVAFLSVRGNNEIFCEKPYRIIQEFGGIRFYITHGHREHVKTGHEGLIRAAKENHCQVALYGHTHKTFNCTVEGIHLINPGALSYPTHSCALLSTTDEGLDVQFFTL